MALNISIPRDLLARRYSRYYIYLEPVVSDPLIRGYFSFVASLFLVAFLLVFALSPTVNTMLTLQKKIAEERQLVTSLERKIETMVVAQQNYSQIENDLSILTAALPTTPAPQTIASGIAVSASTSGVTVTALRFADVPLSPDQFSNNRANVDFTMTVTGSTDKVRDFLKRLESLPRQIRVVTLVLGKTAEQNGDIVNVVASGYYLAEKGHEKR